eukprot:m.134516 g.134516  ORF g.134516 m.134516 type:complete len:518 (-) comp9622_c0_seq1:231-1784(-)
MSTTLLQYPKVFVTNNVAVDGADCIILVSDFQTPCAIDSIQKAVDVAKSIDDSATSQVNIIPCEGVAGGRVVLSSTGPVSRDFDDVRRFGDAAKSGVARAVQAGSKKPLLVVQFSGTKVSSSSFDKYVQVAALGALGQCYVPLEVREDKQAPPSATRTIETLFVFSDDASLPDFLQSVEGGRVVCRDICGSDPERMAPLRAAEYIETLFQDSCVKVDVHVSDSFSEQYPLLEAVARCSRCVERHHPCVINLEYVGEGEVEKTLFFVGKGITYDTGGADIKAGGVMAGMHRDKGGASSICGFMYILSQMKPKNIRVVAKLAMVRNSVGSDAYVADEIIRARSGQRIRVGNTDAEGRMVMADVLCEAKEEALVAVNPFLFTMATLTGHAVRAYGTGYFASMDNGPAKEGNVSQSISDAGFLWGDPCEISTVRREDFAFIQSKYMTEDVVQSNSAPSTGTMRGHQFPAAFLTMASGLNNHGSNSDNPLPYTHMDIAGSTQMWPTPVSGSPILALFGAFLQ